jgi:hypothetical protein
MSELIISSFSIGFVMAVSVYFMGYMVPMIQSFFRWK